MAPQHIRGDSDGANGEAMASREGEAPVTRWRERCRRGVRGRGSNGGRRGRWLSGCEGESGGSVCHSIVIWIVCVSGESEDGNELVGAGWPIMRVGLGFLGSWIGNLCCKE